LSPYRLGGLFLKLSSDGNLNFTVLMRIPVKGYKGHFILYVSLWSKYWSVRYSFSSVKLFNKVAKSTTTSNYFILFYFYKLESWMVSWCRIKIKRKLGLLSGIKKIIYISNKFIWTKSFLGDFSTKKWKLLVHSFLTTVISKHIFQATIN
jgi:hypothetical protein